MAVSEATELLTKLHNMVGDAQDAVRGLHDGWDHYSQFYQGQHLNGDKSAVCLEPGAPPNAVNGRSPDAVILGPGRVYRARIQYEFSW